MRAWDTSAMVSLWRSGQFEGAGSLIPPYEFRDWTQGLGLGGQHLYLWSRPEESRDKMFLLCVCCIEILFSASGPHCWRSSFLRLSSLQCWNWTRVLDNCRQLLYTELCPQSTIFFIWKHLGRKIKTCQIKVCGFPLTWFIQALPLWHGLW